MSQKIKPFFQKEKDGKIRCKACSHYCLISKNKRGICGVRKNEDGKLKLLTGNRLADACSDPIEKKPLYHFLPRTPIFSIGTLGCNFSCKFCQNWSRSQMIKGMVEEEAVEAINRGGEKILSKEIVSMARAIGCPSIAYTYNEPTVFVEVALETMQEARKSGLKNVWVSNGFMSKETREAIVDYLDGVNIDLKSFSPNFYQNICGARIEPVLENIVWFWEKKVWIEVTTLIIPDENDSQEELEKIAGFLVSISPDIPWHVTAFFPTYKMKNKLPTPQKKLLEAFKIGKKMGLKYIYVGNDREIEDKYCSTFCPFCGKRVIHRDSSRVVETTGLENGNCLNCRQKIAGIWN